MRFTMHIFSIRCHSYLLREGHRRDGELGLPLRIVSRIGVTRSGSPVLVIGDYDKPRKRRVMFPPKPTSRKQCGGRGAGTCLARMARMGKPRE